MVKCIAVEAGKDPITQEIGTTISIKGEDFSNDKFDSRYESAQDGETFALPKANVITKVEKTKEKNITPILLICVSVLFVLGIATTSIILIRRRGR